MSAWEAAGKSDEWYTPPYIFNAMQLSFDLDVASSDAVIWVPCVQKYTRNGLTMPWKGFVWCNPPFGGRNGIAPWCERFFEHGNGVLLTPDRTSAPWWQQAAKMADAVLFISPKVKFISAAGVIGKSPSTGTTLMAVGMRGTEALRRAQTNGLGVLMIRP